MMARIKRSPYSTNSPRLNLKNWFEPSPIYPSLHPGSIPFRLPRESNLCRRLFDGISETIIQPVLWFRLMRRPLVEFTTIFKGMAGFLRPVYPSGGCHGSSVRGTFQPLFFTGFRNGERRSHLRFVHGPIKYDRCSGSCGSFRVYPAFA